MSEASGDEPTRRYCNYCDTETVVQRTRGNTGIIEYCPNCSFPYSFASGPITHPVNRTTGGGFDG